jgi:hypothetical protein
LIAGMLTKEIGITRSGGGSFDDMSDAEIESALEDFLRKIRQEDAAAD